MLRPCLQSSLTRTVLKLFRSDVPLISCSCRGRLLRREMSSPASMPCPLPQDAATEAKRMSASPLKHDHGEHGHLHAPIASPSKHHGEISPSTTPLSPAAAQSASFYRRPLPADLIAFSSETGKKLFRESMEAGFAEGYFSLAEQFTTQSEPACTCDTCQFCTCRSAFSIAHRASSCIGCLFMFAVCGLSTLTMVLNALALDPNRQWKGPWRWYSGTCRQILFCAISSSASMVVCVCVPFLALPESCDVIHMSHAGCCVVLCYRRGNVGLLCTAAAGQRKRHHLR